MRKERVRKKERLFLFQRKRGGLLDRIVDVLYLTVVKTIANSRVNFGGDQSQVRQVLV
jgi:hypothetical protein